MKRFTLPSHTCLLLLFLGSYAVGQGTPNIGQNAALRYWAAFSEIQDANISPQQADELNAVLDGKARYDDSKYRDLLDKNALALRIMSRATSLAKCDWGLDYGLGEDVPVDYARKALVLGRLNVLYALHLFALGDKEAGVRTLSAGLRFSRDIANGGSLFATLISKDLLVNHLGALGDALQTKQLSKAQRSRLQVAVAQLRDGLDWRTAAARDLEALRAEYAADSQTSAALSQIISAYTAALDNQSKLAQLNEAVAKAPSELANFIPNAKKVLEQKQDLQDHLQKTIVLLR